ncbi:MAG: hypothetical protein JWQ75_3733 [Pseudarthrobacter sp.]|nr:hypothetical protein [Pseudarthrobacter sp.]
MTSVPDTTAARKVSLTVTIVPASKPHFAGFVPELARLDVIMGTVSGPVAEPGNADPWQDLWFYTNPIFVGITD